jgi:hypothetical protein
MNTKIVVINVALVIMAGPHKAVSQERRRLKMKRAQRRRATGISIPKK